VKNYGGSTGAGRKLVIVESPAKAKTIGKYLGSEFRVLATAGHIRDLPVIPRGSKFGINLSSWTGDYEISESKMNAVQAIIKAAAEVDSIFIASDPDREGEAIAWHVAEVLGMAGKVKRATWTEITPRAIEAGLGAAREVDMTMVRAQEARRFLDRLVGYTVSPWLAKKLNLKGASAGRVQSVVARLVVDRDRAIETFNPKPYGGASLVAEIGGMTFEANLLKVGGLQVVGPEKEGQKGVRVLTPEEARALRFPARGEKLTVLYSETKPGKRSPQAPFITTTMTVAASNRLGMNTETTMRVAQKLYEAGLITYHRSDSPNISQEALQMARAYVADEYGEDYLPKAPRQFKAKGEHAQEGHECIRPSHMEPRYAAERARSLAAVVASEGKKAEELFDLIWKRFAACQMADKQYDATVVHLGFGDGADVVVFRAAGNVTKFEGWAKAYAEDEGPDDAGAPAAVLPPMQKGQTITAVKCSPQSKKTKAPAAFTEASLITELERLNIGRPSTLATIFATLRNRGYMETTSKGGRKNVLSSTELGRKAVDALVSQFPKEMDPHYTSNMEDSLGEIAQGKLAMKAFMDGFWKELSKHF
jgi:DNA topoisomerase-1